MPDEPAIDAWQMEQMLAMRQAPHSFISLEVLKPQSQNHGLKHAQVSSCFSQSYNKIMQVELLYKTKMEAWSQYCILPVKIHYS